MCFTNYLSKFYSFLYVTYKSRITKKKKIARKKSKKTYRNILMHIPDSLIIEIYGQYFYLKVIAPVPS